ncbi:THO complex subunit 3 [Perkinsus chesapeaki]|uniref:THO complex subunit 3 n=1 Tax=Perkinsus chesapeaki TaxID=330153 RepID=A0A7J6MT97_PERCH|nr:THO complex subunit 3 [Perkinsus chesapeaki]
MNGCRQVNPYFIDQHYRLLNVFNNLENYAKFSVLGNPNREGSRPPKLEDVDCLDWTCDGDRLVVAHRNCNMVLWNVNRCMQERQWTGDTWTWVEPHPIDPHVIVGVTFNGLVKVLDTRAPTGRDGLMFSAEFSKNPGPTQPKGLDKLLNVTWHPEGRFLAVYGRAGTIQILDPRVVVSSPPVGGGEQPAIGTFALGQQINAAANTEVYSILWDNYCEGPHSLWAATTGAPSKIVLYDDDTLLKGPQYQADAVKPSEVLIGHQSTTFTLSRSMDGRFMASGGGDSLVDIWSVADLSCIRTFSSATHVPIQSVSLSHDGSLVAYTALPSTGGNDIIDRNLVIAGTMTGVEYVDVAQKFTGKNSRVPHPVNHVAWSPKEHVLAYSMTASAGGSTDPQPTSLISIMKIDADNKTLQDCPIDF